MEMKNYFVPIDTKTRDIFSWHTSIISLNTMATFASMTQIYVNIYLIMRIKNYGIKLFKSKRYISTWSVMMANQILYGISVKNYLNSITRLFHWMVDIDVRFSSHDNVHVFMSFQLKFHLMCNIILAGGCTLQSLKNFIQNQY